DQTTGLTLIKMNEGMDEGDMLAKVEMPISVTDTAQTLSQKMSQLAGEWISPVLGHYLQGKLEQIPQNHSEATYSGIIKKTDGFVDLTHPPQNLEAMIRAYYPWPGVWGE